MKTPGNGVHNAKHERHLRRSLLLAFALTLGAPLRPVLAQPAGLEINEASQAQLESLPGIGPALAERILAARAQAPFESWGDLRKRVSGIGPKVAQKLSDQGLRVQGQPYSA